MRYGNIFLVKKDESVFLEEWYELDINDSESNERQSQWNEIILIRDEVNRQLELLRENGTIGSSLDAEVDLYCDENIYQNLSKLDDELHFVLITSYARIHREDGRVSEAVESEISGLYIHVKPSKYNKCVRCWHHHEEVGFNEMHPELCERCIENVDGEGETRQYA